MKRRFLIASILLVLGGTVLPPLVESAIAAPPATYTVRSGDSLIRIARRLGITVDELRGDNHIETDLIRIGQELRIERPFHKFDDRDDLRWSKPVASFSRILKGFGRHADSSGASLPHTGANVAVEAGAAVHAAADGVVRYVGEQEGFGTLIIIVHGAGFSTVLTPLDPERLKVDAGDVVLRGDLIGHVGPPVEHPTSYLHIELRRNNGAIRPNRLLR